MLCKISADFSLRLHFVLGRLILLVIKNNQGFNFMSQVGLQESLSSIALKFNITPNKLVQLNRLFCRSIYPGQVMFQHIIHHFML